MSAEPTGTNIARPLQSAQSKMLHQLPWWLSKMLGFEIRCFELFLFLFYLGGFPQTHPCATTIFVDELDAGLFEALFFIFFLPFQCGRRADHRSLPIVL